MKTWDGQDAPIPARRRSRQAQTERKMVHSSQLGPESDGNRNQALPPPAYAPAGLPNALGQDKSGDEATIASEARYRSLFDASPDAIILTDLQTRILMC